MVLLGYVLTMVTLAIFAFVSGSISVIVNVDSMALSATGIVLGMVIMFRGRRDILAIVLRELVTFKAERNSSNEAAHALTGASIIAFSFSLLSMCQGLYSGFLQESGFPL